MQPQTSQPDQPVSYGTPPSDHHNLKAFISTVLIVATAFIVAAFVMFFVFRSYQVDGPSMEPTLHNNDRLIIWKLGRTWARVAGHSYIPNRGDVIVFSEKQLLDNNGNPKQLIKRVIGVPGDRIAIKNGSVTVYNKEHPNGFRPDTTLPYGEHVNLSVDSTENIDEVIGKGEVYAMGDNRNNSLDSRVFGPVDANDIIGKLILRMFPINDVKKF
jgi:signal peptidase I